MWLVMRQTESKFHRQKMSTIEETFHAERHKKKGGWVLMLVHSLAYVSTRPGCLDMMGTSYQYVGQTVKVIGNAVFYL